MVGYGMQPPTTSSQPPQPLLTVMRGFNLFSKPLLLSRRRGLTRKIAETVDFSLFWYRGTRDEFFIAAALGKLIKALNSIEISL